MKLKNLLFAGAVSLASLGAVAQEGPHIEPGPQMKLEDVAAEAVDALMLAKASDVKTYQKAGNTTKEVTRQNWQPGVTVYTFTRQQCALGGIAGGTCLGGARLQVVVREKQSGSMMTVTATSTVALIK